MICASRVRDPCPVAPTLDDYTAQVLPVFRLRHEPGQRPKPEAFCGTGFVLEGNVFVTCRHCVEAAVPDDEFYAAIVKATAPDGTTTTRYLPLADLEPDGNRTDLAIARIECSPRAGLVLTQQPPQAGEDVFTYGYPLVPPRPVAQYDGRRVFPDVNPRYLRGYITQVFRYPEPSGRVIPSIEIDMPAPGGLSGAPLLRAGTNEVVGVIYGENEVQAIVSHARVDETTGDRTPEIVSYTKFALAHWTETLYAATAAALDGSTLGIRSALAHAGKWSAWPGPSQKDEGEAEVLGPVPRSH